MTGEQLQQTIDQIFDKAMQAQQIEPPVQQFDWMPIWVAIISGVFLLLATTGGIWIKNKGGSHE